VLFSFLVGLFLEASLVGSLLVLVGPFLVGLFSERRLFARSSSCGGVVPFCCALLRAGFLRFWDGVGKAVEKMVEKRLKGLI
jgi:hypothetical protein